MEYSLTLEDFQDAFQKLSKPTTYGERKIMYMLPKLKITQDIFPEPIKNKEIFFETQFVDKELKWVIII